MIKPNTLAKSYDWHSFFFTLDHVSCNSEIPVHCHLLDFVSCLFSNDIIYSQSAEPTHFTSWSNMCTLDWKHLMCGKKIFCAFLSVPHGKPYTCPFYVYIFPTKYIFVTHSDWLQLLLHASSWNHYRVTTEIWLILGWRGEVGRNLRLVKIWKHYHQLYQKYQITKRWRATLIILLLEKMTCTILVNSCITKHSHQLYQKYQITKRYVRQLIISLPEKMTCTILVNLCISLPCWTHDNKKKKMLYDKLMKCLIKQFFIKINIAQYLFQK